MKCKHYNDNKKKKKRKTKNIIIPTLLLIFISIMIFTGIKIFNWLKENKDSNDIIEDIQDSISIDDNTDTVDKYNVDFDSLKQKNSDRLGDDH